MTENNKRYFGTDGIRGRVGESLVNPESVLKLGWAIGRALANGHRKKVLIGKDTRVSGYLLESALEAGLSAAGVDIHLLGPMPTPAIAYLTRTLRAAAGIVISASHNPYYDNGIKIFSEEGKKLSDKLEFDIEQQFELPLRTVAAKELGKAKRIHDAPGRYIEFCKSTIATDIRLNGLKIVVDCAHGATYHIAPKVFQELDAHVIELATSPNGFNINENCGSTNPESLRQKVIAEKADLGVAFDGDGDRVVMVDHEGRIVDGDQILYIIAAMQYKRQQLQGGVVGTQMSNLGLELALQKLGIPFARAKVGDRYVMELLQSNKWHLGGESSGHVVCLNQTTTGDGIIAALQVLSAMQQSDMSLAELHQRMVKLPQILINIQISDAQRVMAHPGLQQAVNECSRRLGDTGRILLRPSGTEPVIRLMVEGHDKQEITQVAQTIAAIVEEQR